MVCKKCQQPINNAKETAKCVKCASEFHPACCRIRTAAKLNAMVTGGTSSAWKCDQCSETTPSQTNTEADSTAVMGVLKSIQSQMEANKKTIQSQMEENKRELNGNFASLQSTLAALKVSFDGLEKKLTRVESDNLELKSRCSKLEEANLKLTKEIRDLKWVTMESEQYSKLRNIEILGIPEKEGEDIYNLLSAIAKTLKVTYQPGEFSSAHRLAPSRNSFPTAIVVSFVRRSVRAEWLEAARAIKIKASDVMASFGATPVYINEHLTKHNRDLLKEAKNRVKAGDLTHAWVREGKVYVRRAADARARRLYWALDDQPRLQAPTAAAPAPQSSQ